MNTRQIERMVKTTEPNKLKNALKISERVQDETFRAASRAGKSFDEACDIASDEADLRFHIEMHRQI